MNEPAESDLLTLPPRDIKRSRLVDWTLIGYAYMFYGNMESIAAFINYFAYMSNRGSNTPKDQGYPASYRPFDLLFAWEWGVENSPRGLDQRQAALTGAIVTTLTSILALLCPIQSSCSSQ
jgi:Cation transporting ATPase, C-terminus